ncbi:MAG: HAD hydrolase-like protein [Syntrophomonas sp.]|nr:HAD hydrolase-like protein [Syntrophomonas sp.]
MNIGVDIDNTITNTREIILDYVRKFDQENGLKTKVDLSQYSLEKSLMWDAKVIKRFLSTYLADIYASVRPKPHAIEVIKDLHQCHSIILITSRNQRDLSITESTLEWLSRYQLRYDKLVMNNTENMHHFSKLASCLENDIDLMIEDHHDLSLELSEKIPVLMFDYPYNTHLDVTNITRVKDWLEVKEIIAGIPSPR